MAAPNYLGSPSGRTVEQSETERGLMPMAFYILPSPSFALGKIHLSRGERQEEKAPPFWMELFLCEKNYFLLLMYLSMDLAPSLPAPIARITVAAPVTASPPAKTPSREVQPPSSASMPPFLVKSRPLVV